MSGGGPPPRGRRDVSWLAVAPAGLLIGLFLVLPAGLGLIGSFTDLGPSGGAGHFVGLANYRAVLADPSLGVAFGNAALLTALTAPIAIGTGLALALALRRPFRGRGLVRVLLLAPWLVSPIASGVLWHFLYNSQVGLLGWAAGWSAAAPHPLADPHWALPAVAGVEVWRLAPLAGFLLLPGVLAVPQDDLDAATLAGSPARVTLLQVILPRLRGLLLTVLLLLIADSLTTFDGILVLTGGGPGSSTMVPALYSYTLAVTGHDWPQATTVAWLLLGLMLAVGAGYLRLLRPPP
ncbi:MAG TPA: sugar ABC transporter permease [Chloroflexia bacterium]|nr:sugar ABC transporter permease [Chloroflexia bacterium]